MVRAIFSETLACLPSFQSIEIEMNACWHTNPLHSLYKQIHGTKKKFSFKLNCVFIAVFALIKLIVECVDTLVLVYQIKFTVFVVVATIQTHFPLQQYLRFTLKFTYIFHAQAIPFVLPCPCLSMCSNLCFFLKKKIYSIA